MHKAENSVLHTSPPVKITYMSIFSWILSIEDNYILHSAFISAILPLPPCHMLFVFFFFPPFLCSRNCLTQQEQRAAVCLWCVTKLFHQLFLPRLFLIFLLSYICLGQSPGRFVTKKFASSCSVYTL